MSETGRRADRVLCAVPLKQQVALSQLRLGRGMVAREGFDKGGHMRFGPGEGPDLTQVFERRLILRCHLSRPFEVADHGVGSPKRVGRCRTEDPGSRITLYPANVVFAKPEHLVDGAVPIDDGAAEIRSCVGLHLEVPAAAGVLPGRLPVGPAVGEVSFWKMDLRR